MDAVMESEMKGRNPRVSTRFSLYVENGRADAGPRWLKLYRETEFSGANGDVRGTNMFGLPVLSGHQQDS